MGVIAPINHIELRENGSAVIAGTGLKVHVIAPMFVSGEATAEWIMETYELTPAQFYAALSYYYDHQTEIDEYLRETHEWLEKHAVKSSDLIARMQARLQQPTDTDSTDIADDI